MIELLVQFSSASLANKARPSSGGSTARRSVRPSMRKARRN
ncbi:hypothetical protein ALO80_200059 [Pseudomonas caricapapayae]|nr:hypothetical protein ALO80_200059 [Pseudomonas caricapapayae]